MLGPKVVKFNNIKMVLYIKENQHIFDISLDMCILLSSIATVDHLQCIVTFLHDAVMCQFVSE